MKEIFLKSRRKFTNSKMLRLSACGEDGKSIPKRVCRSLTPSAKKQPISGGIFASRKASFSNRTSDPTIHKTNKTGNMKVNQYLNLSRPNTASSTRRPSSSMSILNTLSSKSERLSGGLDATSTFPTSNIKRPPSLRLKRCDGCRSIAINSLITKSTQTIDQNGLKFLISMENGVAKLVQDENFEDLQRDSGTNMIQPIKEIIKSMNETLNHIKSSFDHKKIEFLQSQTTESWKSLEELETHFKNMNSLIFELKNEVKLKDERLLGFENDLEQFSSGGGDFKSSDAQLKRTIEILEFENVSLTEERNILEDEKIHLLSAFETSSIDLQFKIDEARERLKIFEASNDVLRNRLGEIEESSKKKNDALTRSLEKVESKLHKTKAELEQREQEVLLHQKILKDRCELLEDSQDQNKSNERKISKLSSDIENKSKHIKLIKIEIEAKSNEIQRLNTLLDQRQTELNGKDNIIESLKNQDGRNQQIQVDQSRRIEELEIKITELNKANVLNNFQESTQVCTSTVNSSEKYEEFQETQSKRIDQLQDELYEANVRAETYQEILRSINEARRLYLVEQRNKILQ